MFGEEKIYLVAVRTMYLGKSPGNYSQQYEQHQGFGRDHLQWGRLYLLLWEVNVVSAMKAVMR